MKKRVAIAMTAFCLMSSSALAAEIKNCDISADGIITIESSLDSKKEEATVSIMVLRPGVSADSLLENEENISNVAEVNRTESGKDGAYTFQFAIDGQSDFYDCIVGSDAGDKQSFQILYSSPEEAKIKISQLNNASDEEEFYNVIFGEDEGYKALAFYLSLPEKAEERKVSDLLYSYVNNKSKLDENDTKAAADIYKKLYVMELLNEEKEIPVSDFEKYLGIESYEFFKYYGKDYITEAVKEEIFKGLFGNDFKSEEDLEEGFLKQLILKTVRFSDGYGNIRDILTEYESKTGIDTDKLTRENYNKVLGKNYASYSDLEDDLTGKPSQGSGSGSSGSGSGSSGSGSGSGNQPFIGSSSIVVSSDASNQEKLEPIYYEDETSEIFSDIGDFPWAKDAIESLNTKGIVSGKGDKLFCPGDDISREEFAAIIVRTMGIEGKSADVKFSDVSGDEWFCSYINAAAAEGIVLGKDDGSFGVGETITREDMAVMLYRALKLEDESLESEAFPDDEDISEYAKTAVYSMKNKNVITGFTDGSFMPKASATRAEAAVMIYRAFF